MVYGEKVEVIRHSAIGTIVAQSSARHRETKALL